MNDIVFTGLVMAGAYGIMKLVRKMREKAQSRLEEQKQPAEPRDLGVLKPSSDGTYVPDSQQNAG